MSSPGPMYVPDPAKLVSQIRETLLGDAAGELADVILHTPDGKDIPACKVLLSMRSQYFKRLFFSNFSERGASTISIGISSKLLLEVMEFAYTGDSTLLSSIHTFTQNGLLRRCASPDTCRSHISDLIDLGIAADYCDMVELHRWCRETLRCFVRAVPKTACLVLERTETHAIGTELVSRSRLLRSIARSPTDCLLVPDVADRNPFKWRTSRLEESPESSPEHAAEEFGVLQLSSRTLEVLIQQLLTTTEELHSNVQQEYLFQVIYFWATSGRVVSKGDDSCTPPSETDVDRWEHAKRLVATLDIKAMKPTFVQDYVDGSGLAERETLLQAYRYHATKSCERNTARIAVEADRITIAEPETNKVLKMRRKLALLSELPDAHDPRTGPANRMPPDRSQIRAARCRRFPPSSIGQDISG